MPLFRRVKTVAGSPDNAAVPFDPACGDPDAVRLCAAMSARDWPAARAILDGRDHEHLSFLVDVAAEVPDGQHWLPDVVRSDLRDTLALLMYAARAVCWAWEAHSATEAKNVSRDRFAVFQQRLRLAEDCLQDVVRREPDNATGWYQMLPVARGLDLGQDEARRRFDQVVQYQPGHVWAHRQMLQQLCRKSGGSHSLMHGFAREATLTAAPGSPLGCLVADAYLEEWRDSNPARVSLLMTTVARERIREAADKSVRHPAYRQRPGWPRIHNSFAMAFSLSAEVVLAAEQFRVIGDRATHYPWCYLDRNPRLAFAQRRHKALAAGGGRVSAINKARHLGLL
jgi:hypothetical protein